MPDALPQFADEVTLTAALALVMFTSNPDAMVLVDDDAKIRLANPQTVYLTGYPTSELVGQPIELLVPDELKERHVEHRDGYLDDMRVRPMGRDLNLRLRRKNGSTVSVLINLAPAPVAQGRYVIATIRRAA